MEHEDNTEDKAWDPRSSTGPWESVHLGSRGVEEEDRGTGAVGNGVGNWSQRHKEDERWTGTCGERNRRKINKRLVLHIQNFKTWKGSSRRLPWLLLVELTITQHWSLLSYSVVLCRCRGIALSWSAFLLIAVAASARSTVLVSGRVGVAACWFTTVFTVLLSVKSVFLAFLESFPNLMEIGFVDSMKLKIHGAPESNST